MTTPYLIPITNSPFMYINDMPVTVASNTTLSVAAGQCRDSTNTYDLALATAGTINAAVTGVNGLDTGTFAASKWYYVFVIADMKGINPNALLISLSQTAPIMPTGYNLLRMIGISLTDGSVHFLPFTTFGKGTNRTQFWTAAISVLSGGTSATYAAVSLDGAVPPIAATPFTAKVTFVPATANDYVDFRPTGSAATAVASFNGGTVAAKNGIGQMKLLAAIASSVSKIDYQNSAASGATSVSVLSFDYSL